MQPATSRSTPGALPVPGVTRVQAEYLAGDQVKLEGVLGDHNAQSGGRCVCSVCPRVCVASGAVDVIPDGNSHNTAGSGCGRLGAGGRGGGGAGTTTHTGRSRSVLTLTSHVLSHAVLHCTYLNVKPPELSKNVALVDIPGPQKPVCQCGVTVWRQREGEHRNRDAKHQRELQAKFEGPGEA